MAVQWVDAFATGDIIIDQQHKTLFDHLNELERTLQKDKVTKESVDEILAFLEDYTVRHFSLEERIMAEGKCPVSGRNCEAHKRFLKVLDSLKQKYREQGFSKELLGNIHSIIEKWLENHICTTDIKLKEHIVPIQSAPSEGQNLQVALDQDKRSEIGRQIDAAIEAHGKWKSRFEKFMETGHFDISFFDIRKDNQCDFGKWLYSDTLPVEIKNTMYYTEAIEQHKKFHMEADYVARLIILEQLDEAKIQLYGGGEYSEASRGLNAMLTEWRQALS